MGIPFRTLWLLAAILAASGCSALKQTLSNQECRLEPGNPYDVVTIDPTRDDIVLLWKDAAGMPLMTFSRARRLLEARGDSVIALTNGGIFTREHAPLGLYVEAGHKEVPLNRNNGYGNFYLKPNGVLLITDQGASISDSDTYDPDAPVPLYALQSGPLMVSGGKIHPAFTKHSPNCRLRSGIGVDADGRVHLVISNGAVNFHDFATLFKQTLRCDDALYLDGAISALFAPALGRNRLSGRRFATFLAVVAGR